MLVHTAARVAVILMSLIVFGSCYQANGQSSPTALFTSVTNEKDVQINAEQSQRLQRIRDLPTTESVHILRANPLLSLGNELAIPISAEKVLVLSKTGGENLDPKDFTWFGITKGQETGSATLIARNGEISGSISTSFGVYRISSLGDGLYVIAKMDIGKLPAEEPPKRASNH